MYILHEQLSNCKFNVKNKIISLVNKNTYIKYCIYKYKTVISFVN